MPPQVDSKVDSNPREVDSMRKRPVRLSPETGLFPLVFL
jgi:hypothetical protein